MAKNNKRKMNKKSDNQVLYLVLFAFTFIFIVSTIILKDKMGVLGALLSKGIFIVFGLTSYVVPLYILFMFFALRNKKFMEKHGSDVLIVSLLLINIAIFVATFYVTGNNYNEAITNSYNQALKYTGVGVIFASIYYLFYVLISNIGIYIISSVSFFISIFYFLDLSISNFFKGIFYSIRNLIRKIFEKSNKTIEVTNKKMNNRLNHETAVNKNSIESVEKVEPRISYYNSSKEKTDDLELSNEEVLQIGLDYSDDYEYQKPPIDLLNDQESIDGDDESVLLKNAQIIVNTLASFDIQSEVVNINNGPTVTSYEVKPQSGIKVSRIVNLSNDLSMALSSPGIRIEAPIPGKPYVGIEVPNIKKDIVTFKSLITTDQFMREDNDITVALGKDIFGKPLYAKINEMPHLLIAGATGSGKSVLMNAIIMSIIYKYSPQEVEFIMIDPKMVELKVYSGIPHLKGRKVVTKATEATASLHKAVKEMTSRFELFAKLGTRDIEAYNARVLENDEEFEGEKIEKLPYLLVIIDELSDLMMEASKDVENYITRLAQMGRASGVHLIIATQRPSVNVITGIIKANIPSRIAFQVTSNVDSRTIIDISGAEKLLGKGDMLYYPGQLPKPKRAQGAFVTDHEVERVVDYIKNHNESIKNDNDFNKIIETIDKPADPLDEVDELFDEAVDFVLREDQASISAIQRRFRVGYARAGRIIDQMTRRGIISEQDGSKPRNILVTREEYELGNNQESEVEDEFSE